MGHLMDIANWANELKDKLLQSQKDVVILDMPEVTMDDVAGYPKDTTKVVTCYAAGEGNKYADVVILPAEGPIALNLRKERGQSIWFYGPKYRLLRPEFTHFKDRHQESGKIETVLVMLGGTDAAGLAQSVGQQLKDYEVIYARGRKDIPELLSDVDLAIVSPGFSMWEALYVGCPVLIVPQNARQERYRADFPLVERIETIPELIQDRMFVLPDPAFEISEGKQELFEEILR